MHHQKRVKSRTKHNKKKMTNKKTKRATRKRRTQKKGGGTSYIVQEYNKYRNELMAAGDADKLRELQEGGKLLAVITELIGEQNASRVQHAMRSGHLQTFLKNGDLNVKVFLDFVNFGMIYQCDFTDNGEVVVGKIKLAFPNNIFKSISYRVDAEDATEGMENSDKQIVYMFVRAMEPSYDALMDIVA